MPFLRTEAGRNLRFLYLAVMEKEGEYVPNEPGRRTENDATRTTEKRDKRVGNGRRKEGIEGSDIR